MMRLKGENDSGGKNNYESMAASASDSRPIIYISSRASALALYQTNHVKHLLEQRNPNYQFVIGLADTLGDQILDRHLADIGTSMQSGLFIKGLESELIAGRSRLAVHSLKDMPTRLPNGLALGAICKRESTHDAIILHPKHIAKGCKGLTDLPKGAIVGTSSLRREAMLKRYYPSVAIKTIRGNIQTRLKKESYNADEYDAIIVAAVGFERGGLGNRINQILPEDNFGYAVGQGSIGVECRADDKEMLRMLKEIEDELSAQCCQAERSLLYHLEGGCQISMGVQTTLNNDELTLHAMLLSLDGQTLISKRHSGLRYDAEKIGYELALMIKKVDGSQKLLGESKEKRPSTYGDIEAPGDASKNLKSLQ